MRFLFVEKNMQKRFKKKHEECKIMNTHMNQKEKFIREDEVDEAHF